MMNKTTLVLIVFLAFVVGAGLGFAIYYSLKGAPAPEQKAAPAVTEVPTDWQFLKDQKVGFSVRYPAGWQANDWTKEAGSGVIGWYSFTPKSYFKFNEITPQTGIILRVSSKKYEQELEIMTGYEPGILKERTEEPLIVDGQAAKKFTGYKVDPTTGEKDVAKTVAIVIDGPVNPFIFETTASFAEDLDQMVKTLDLAGQREGLSETIPSAVDMPIVEPPQ